MPAASRILSRRRMIVLSSATAASLLSAACGGQTAAVATASAPAATATAPAASAVSVSSATTAASAPAVATSGAASSASLVQTASTTATSSSAAVSAAAKAPAPGTTTIEFWQYGGTPYQTVFEQWASQFAATHSSIQVKDTTYATNNNQKLTVVMAAGTDPDAYLSDSDGFKNRAFAGLEGPIDDLVAQDKTVGANLKQMLPSAVQWYQYNGKSYGLPWDYGVSVVIYNLDHMHAAGLTPPAELASDPAKWTWDTLQQYAEQLTVQKAGSVDRAGLHLGWDGYEGSWYSLALANGGRYYNQALDQCTIAGPACVKALDYAAAMAKAGGNATPDWWKTVTGAYKNAAGVFTAGKVSMHYGVSAIFTALAQAKTGIAWDATFLPYDPTTGKTGNWSNMAGLVMNPQSKHRDEAFQFLVYLTTAEAQDAIAAATGECPARLDSVAKTYLVPKVAGPPPGRSTLKPAIDASVTDGTPYVNEDDAWNWMTTAATDVFSGKSTAQEALTALQSQMQAAINTAKARGPRNKRSSGTARRRRAARALAGRSSASSS